MKLLLLVVATLALSASAVSYCGKQRSFDVSSVDSGTKNGDVFITVEGTLDAEVLSGNVEAKVKYSGINLIKADAPLEDGSSLPSGPGSFVYSQSVEIPDSAPKGDYTVDLTFSDQDGKTLTCVTAGFTVSASAPTPAANEANEMEFLFENWRQHFGKEFQTPEEYLVALETFAVNHMFISKHNAGNHTYTMAHNEFSHISWEEFRLTHLGFGNVPQKRFDSPVNDFANVDIDSLPASVDWEAAGAVTPVKNQGQCGSCWSFSTTGALEGAYQIKNGNLVSFSEQELVDCDYTDSGCNGGLMTNAFDWIMKNGGLCSESSYPYTAQDGSCHSSQCTNVPNSAPKSYTNVGNSAAAMQAAVAQQPIAIAIEADQSGFQFYSSGVFTGSCGSNLDHGVLNVGYGTMSGVDYWKVKNSWGSSWGSNGYINLQRGKSQYGGQCGLLLMASYPTM